MATPTGTVFTVTDLNGATYNIHGVLYGYCTTSATTAAKVVSIPGITSITDGLSIRVRFQNAQTYNGAPTLNVNSLGAKTIKRFGSTNAKMGEWIAGEVVDFVYNGSYWLIVNGGKEGLPTVTTSDNGKILTVQNGTWAAASLPNAEGVSF